MYPYASLYFPSWFLTSAPWDISEINYLNSSPLFMLLLGKHDLIKGTFPLQTQQSKFWFLKCFWFWFQWYFVVNKCSIARNKITTGITPHVCFLRTQKIFLIFIFCYLLLMLCSLSSLLCNQYLTHQIESRVLPHFLHYSFFHLWSSLLKAAMV